MDDRRSMITTARPQLSSGELKTDVQCVNCLLQSVFKWKNERVWCFLGSSHACVRKYLTIMIFQDDKLQTFRSKEKSFRIMQWFDFTVPSRLITDRSFHSSVANFASERSYHQKVGRNCEFFAKILPHGRGEWSWQAKFQECFKSTTIYARSWLITNCIYKQP